METSGVDERVRGIQLCQKSLSTGPLNLIRGDSGSRCAKHDTPWKNDRVMDAPIGHGGQ